MTPQDLLIQKMIDHRSYFKTSQEEMAKRLGVARATYASYENGRSEITFNHAVRIAGILWIDLDKLIQDYEGEL